MNNYRTHLQSLGFAAAVTAVALVGHAWWRLEQLADGVSIGVASLASRELPLALGLAIVAMLAVGHAIRIDRRALKRVLADVDDGIERIERVAAGTDCVASDDSPGRLQAALTRMSARLVSSHDELVTAREAAEARAQAKEDFLANMSHDIRTPMNGVLGLVRIVLKTGLTARQRDQLEKIDASSRSLAAILDDMLDFSKFDSGRFELEEAGFDLDAVLSEVASALGPAVTGKFIRLCVRRDEAVPRLLEGDARRLKRVLLNLVSNAAKITVAREMSLEASRVEEHGPDRVTIRFSIGGAGLALSDEAHQRLVDAFEQSTSSHSARHDGIELGLTLSQRLVERMGGKIVVHSQRDQELALSFAIELRTDGAAAGPQSPAILAAPSAYDQLRGLDALVADDNFTARNTMAAMLRSFGMHVVDAEHGRGALEAARQAEAAGRTFAVALVDWQLPDMDGFAVIDALRRLDSFAKTACIVVSAYERDYVEQRTPGRAAHALLQKPVTPRQLAKSLAATIDQLQPAAHAGAARAAPQILGGLRGRVLLVEDNEINQLVGIEMLAALGLEVRLADDAAQALQQLQQEHFDVVLMDIHMPGVDGLEITRRIRQIPAARCVPVIAMTASLANGERQRCMAAGVNDYLCKPLDPETLGRCIMQWMPPTPEMSGQPART